jgi:hypothetical protein
MIPAIVSKYGSMKVKTATPTTSPMTVPKFLTSLSKVLPISSIAALVSYPLRLSYDSADNFRLEGHDDRCSDCVGNDVD